MQRVVSLYSYFSYSCSVYCIKCIVLKKNGTLTILPRLNSLNHDPGISLGHEDNLTYGVKKHKGHIKILKKIFPGSVIQTLLKSLYKSPYVTATVCVALYRAQKAN